MFAIGGLQKVTLIDFPGRVAATVFLSGCDFRCPWCYSPELVLPEKISKQPQIAEKDFFNFLEERRGLLEGVVICGGEPCLNADLPVFCRKIKELGYLVKLDTNGSRPEILAELFGEELVDYVAMDVKLPKDRYRELPGADIEAIEKSVILIKNSGIDYEFRTTVVPTVHTKEDIINIAQWLSPAKKYCLQNFRPEKTLDPAFKKQKPYLDEELSDIQKAVALFFEVCELR